MVRDIWTTWKWREQPEAPRTWEHPERMVVLMDDLLEALPVTSDRARMDATLGLATGLRDSVVVLCETAVSLKQPLSPFRPERIPALRVERQADLSADAARVLCAVQAQHRALVISPREEIEIRNGRAGRWNFPTATDPGEAYIGVDLVVVRGPTGPDAWPMHPAWVRSIRDQCAGAGVAFAFTGWGEWKPISEALPSDALHATRTAAVWHRREGDPDDLPILSYLVGPERSGHILDGVEHLALPEGL